MVDFRKSSMIGALRKVLKRVHFPMEDMMQERGVFVDHAAVHRWTIKMLPVLTEVFRRRKRPAGKSWRMDESVPRTQA